MERPRDDGPAQAKCPNTPSFGVLRRRLERSRCERLDELHVGRLRIRAPFRGGLVNGCDLFTLENGKIAVKSSYLKSRTA